MIFGFASSRLGLLPRFAVAPSVQCWLTLMASGQFIFDTSLISEIAFGIWFSVRTPILAVILVLILKLILDVL